MTDLSLIPGVTEAEVSALAGLRLYTGDDLLRTNRAELQRRIPGVTLARILGWQAFAELALIEGISPTAAAALRAAGADGLGEFARWPLSRARTALPGESADQIAEWQKDAVRLSQTGVINGNVLLKDGTPVEAAEVSVGGGALRTDARGRFRAVRLPLGAKLTLTVHHPGLGHKLATNVPVTPARALIGQSFTLAGRPQKPRALSELRGQRLPPIGSAPITARAVAGAPDPADILMAIDSYAGGDMRLASRFLDFEAGRFVRRTYRMRQADLPIGLRPGDDIEWNGTLWALARYSAAEIGRKIRLRGVRQRLPKMPWSDAQMAAAMKALGRAVSGR